MKQGARHHTSDDIFVGIDLATRQHQVVVLDAQGCRLTSFKVPHSRAGLRELVERCTSRRVCREGRLHFAFEATGHVWEAVGAFLAQHALRYHVVNPLATFRGREARQMGRDKRDLTDAEQIAQLLRTGVVTQCQLLPANYMQLQRAWGEYHRLRRERARLKTLLVHQLYGVFPELVGEWHTVTAPGCLAVLRAGLTPQRIAYLTKPDFIRVVQAHRRGRRMWRFKIEQVWKKVRGTVGAPEGRARRLTPRRQGGRHPAFPRAGLLQDRHRQDHRRVPSLPLQLHEKPRAHAEPLAFIFARIVSVPL